MILVGLLLCGTACTMACAEDMLVNVTLTSGGPPSTELTGRVFLTAQDGGILLEEPNGAIHNLTPDEFESISETDQPFARLNADALSADLLTTMGEGFSTHITEHYVICSAASEHVTTYVGELLEKVYAEYFDFFSEGDTQVTAPDGPLAVVVFDNVALLKQHAGQLHPEISFDNTPGYYSSRSNQMYVYVSVKADSRGRLLRELNRTPRTTETIVHEAVHQLGYNSGLHTRFADNPLWFTEGIALYFEPSSGRSRLLWSGPGRTNSFHAARMKFMAADGSSSLLLKELLRDNSAFLAADSVADAYALSWGMMYHLLHRERPTFDRVAGNLSNRRLLIEVPTDDELAEFAESAGAPIEQFDRQMRQTIRKLRIRSR